MSPLHRVEELRFSGDGAAPGVARRGPCRAACGGIGRPWRGGRTWRWKQLRGRDLGAGGAAVLEHEGGGRGLRSEDDPFVEDHEAAIEEFAEFDAAAGVGAVLGTGRELQPAGVEMWRKRSSLVSRSCRVRQRRSIRPLASGEPAARYPIPRSASTRPRWVGVWAPWSCSARLQWASLRTRMLMRSP